MPKWATHRCLTDDALAEQARLVARGVRALALVGPCERSALAAVRHRLLGLTVPGAIPFAVEVGATGAECGFASRRWVVDMVCWAWTVPAVQRHRILGLLLGYSPEAIGQFEELTAEGLPANGQVR